MKNKKLLKKSATWIAFFAATLLASKTIVAQPDLVPGINYSYNPPGPNGIITAIEVDACNNNSTAAAAFDVSMYLYDQSSGNYWIIGTTTLTNGLSGNACITISNWDININDTPGIPAGTYRLGVWVDSGEEISETSESNNAGLLSGNINYTPSANSIDHIEWINHVSVFPNPANEQLSIQFNNKESRNVNIEMVDITGRVIKNITNNYLSQGEQTFYCDLSSIPNGTYFIKISSDEYFVTEKVIVAH